MQTPGFGISGHKNQYGSSVKDGNWNEDKFGIDLATKRVIPTLTYETEYSKNHINFRGYPQDPRASKIKFESADEIQTKIRLGLSYSILFSHGNKDKNDKDRYFTVNQTSYHDKDFTAPPCEKMIKREKTINNEMKDTLTLTTQFRNSNLRTSLESSGKLSPIRR